MEGIRDAILEIVGDGQFYAPELIRSRLLTRSKMHLDPVEFYRVTFQMEQDGLLEYFRAEVTDNNGSKQQHLYRIKSTEGQIT